MEREVRRIGVFARGQLWLLFGGPGQPRGYLSRIEALAAAIVEARTQRAEGYQVEVLAQRDDGSLGLVKFPTVAEIKSPPEVDHPKRVM